MAAAEMKRAKITSEVPVAVDADEVGKGLELSSIMSPLSSPSAPFLTH